MAKSIKQQLREEILKQRGLVAGKSRKLKFAPTVQSVDKSKTLAMRLLEQTHGQPIEELIALKYSLSRVSKTLGIDPSTVSKWRTKLGMQ